MKSTKTGSDLAASVAALRAEMAELERRNHDLAEALREAEQTQARIEELSKKMLDAKQREIDELKARLDILCKKLFGRKSEKVSPDQLALAFEQLQLDPSLGQPGEPPELDSGEGTTPAPKTKRKGAHGRSPIPASLPRRRVERDVPESDKWCSSCNIEKTRIGEETSLKLNIVPAIVEAVELARLKYACPCCKKGVVVAQSPIQAVEKGLATEGLLAHVAVSKYADHLPLHRLEKIFARHDVRIPRSTLCDWVGQAAAAVEPVYSEICRQVVASTYIHTDDTPVVLIQPDGKSRKARIWTYVDPKEKLIAYDFTVTHESTGPRKFLGNFKGRLHADAYNGYDQFFRDGRVVEIGCWSHARRRIFDSQDTEPGRARLLLKLISGLFEVEDEARQGNLGAEERRALRQARSVPLLALIDEKRKVYENEVTPKSPLGEGLRYMRNQWAALNRFVDDGEVEIHNNAAENALRTVAVGRNNWLFAGSEQGGRRAAILYSIIASCRLAGVDPFKYLEDILLRIATHPMSRIGELTPARWKALIAPSLAAPIAA